MEKLRFPPISEERKREIVISHASSLLKHQNELNFDLPNLVENEALAFYRKERERRIEYALRFLIPHPIKGEITKGKFKWRGLYIKEDKLHLSSSELKLDGDVPRLVCRFMLPSICGLPSRSGKRKPFEVSLAFDTETMALYQAWYMKNETFMFGVGCRSYGKTAAMYKSKGLIEQIKKGNSDGDKNILLPV